MNLLSLLKGFLLLVFVLTASQCTQPLSEKEFTWKSFISSSHNELIKKVMTNSKPYELQIRYTQINRDEKQTPSFTSYDFNVDTDLYFYPASTVKMPVAFLALQRINELQSQISELSGSTTMLVDSIADYQSPALIDSTSSTGLPSIEHYIKKIFAVSDNDAYNRLYEFLGQDYINKELKQKGVFTNSRIVSRVGVGQLAKSENAFTNPIRFLDDSGKQLLNQQERKAKGNYFNSLRNSIKGKGYYSDELDSVILEPFSFAEKNFINLIDLESGLKRVVFPETFSSKEQFDLSPADYKFLYDAMSAYPTDYPFYINDAEVNYDSYVQFFMFGDKKSGIPEHLHIYNKVGFAYGYLTDCAYIFDTKNNVEFFLSATVHVNSNRIYNDGVYEYDNIGIPFLAELGRQIYQFELSREREHIPVLHK